MADDKQQSAKAAATKTGGRKKKIKAPSEQGRVYIQATFNNTIVSFTDASGKVLTWGSPGTAGFKGTRKSTPFAATTATQQAAERAKQAGLRSVNVFVRGVGSGRDAAIRAIQASGLNVTQLKDLTPIPHNGVRAKKPRRV
ncbi:MAG TPA: 30S ribosomal protein S11 [Patescibacteria group bacterium]|jgi:small subunit ribosomal protein S11